MGRDEEVPEHFGMLHGEKSTPQRAIWTLATISVFVAIAAIIFNFAGPAALSEDTVKARRTISGTALEPGQTILPQAFRRVSSS
jgi:amino acid transporter